MACANVFVVGSRGDAPAGGPLDTPKALILALDIARGLTELHSHDAKIIMRDLKPDNVLLEEHGRAVLTDFGISKVYSTTLGGHIPTVAGVGTEQYM